MWCILIIVLHVYIISDILLVWSHSYVVAVYCRMMCARFANHVSVAGLVWAKCTSSFSYSQPLSVRQRNQLPHRETMRMPPWLVQRLETSLDSIDLTSLSGHIGERVCLLAIRSCNARCVMHSPLLVRYACYSIVLLHTLNTY